MISLGTCTIQATQTLAGGYLAATAMHAKPSDVRRGKTITFATIPSQTYGVPLTLSASSSSAVKPCIHHPNGLHGFGNNGDDGFPQDSVQRNDSNGMAAAPVTRSFGVSKESQTIAFPAIPLQNYGGTVALSAASSSSVCTVSGTATSSFPRDVHHPGHAGQQQRYLAAPTVARNPRSYVQVKPSPSRRYLHRVVNGNGKPQRRGIFPRAVSFCIHNCRSLHGIKYHGNSGFRRNLHHSGDAGRKQQL